MNTIIKNTLYIASIVLTLCVLVSCPGISVIDDADCPEGMGLVSITINPEGGSSGSVSASTGHRAFLPVSNSYKYELKFTSSTAGTKTTEIFGTDNISNYPLPTGTWKLEVTRYEIRNTILYPVARGEVPSFTLAQTGSAYTNNDLKLTKIEDGKGVFNYSVTSKIEFTGKLELFSRTGNLVHDVIFGSPTQTGDEWKTSGTLADVNAGEYIVSVSLFSASDPSRGAGKSFAAVIYTGLETSTTDGFFYFEDDHFIREKRLAGFLKINGYPGLPLKSDGNNVIITALNSGNDVGYSAYVRSSSNPDLQEWIMSIPPGIASVSFQIEVIGSDGHSYIAYNTDLVDVPSNGKDNIRLTIGIYSVNLSNVTSTDNTLVIPGSRAAFMQGETVNMTLDSKYGMVQGSLRANYSGGRYISGTGSNTSYSFVMPDDNVTLRADFYTTLLDSLTVTPAGTNTSVWSRSNQSSPLLAPGTYSFTVANDVSAVNVSAVAKDTGVTIVGNGNISLSTGSINTINIYVTLPTNIGGRVPAELPEYYTLNITRVKSDKTALSTLTVMDGSNSLGLTPVFDSGRYGSFNPYSLTVNNSISSVTIGAIPDAAAAVGVAASPATVLGMTVNNLAEGVNTITVTVTAENGTSTRDYVINITRSVFLSPDTALTRLELLDSAGSQFSPPYEVVLTDLGNLEITVTHDVSVVKISAAAANGATVLENGEVRGLIENSTTTITLHVLAPAGNMTAYYLKVTRDPPPP